MRIMDLFSRRQQQARGELSDVLHYDKIPKELRVQIVHILRDYLGDENEAEDAYISVGNAYKHIVDSLCREYGTFELPGTRNRGRRDYVSELYNFILLEENTERVLDAVELSCRVIDVHSRKWDYRHRGEGDTEATEALRELNTRFRQHGFGFRYESGEVIRVDSEVVHAEIVKPALALLHDDRFKGAEAEFRLAFEHYRHGRAKEALAECLKSLESAIKAIAKIRGWKHDANVTSKPLIDLMFEKQLIPQLWAQHFSGMRAMLESGVPTARNRMSGHGQGSEVIEVPMHLVAFAIHQTAAAIVFLVTAERELK